MFRRLCLAFCLLLDVLSVCFMSCLCNCVWVLFCFLSFDFVAFFLIVVVSGRFMCGLIVFVIGSSFAVFVFCCWFVWAFYCLFNRV